MLQNPSPWHGIYFLYPTFSRFVNKSFSCHLQAATSNKELPVCRFLLHEPRYSRIVPFCKKEFPIHLLQTCFFSAPMRKCLPTFDDHCPQGRKHLWKIKFLPP